MLIKWLKILKIIDIINDNFELLLFFKTVSHVEALDPFRIEIVHDNFCHAYEIPECSPFFVEDGHSVSSCKRVHIW